MYLSLKGSLGHTPITDRVGESLLQIAEGASAAYSLRNLGSDSPSVVRVRRESDNAERDFTAQDINTSVVENWVNQQIIPPLDLRELTPTGRDGPLIEAAAAYSLRSLGTNQWSYGGDTVTYTSDFSAGVDEWFPIQGATSSVNDPVDAGKVLMFTIDNVETQHGVGKNLLTVGDQYDLQAQVYVPSSNGYIDGLTLSDGVRQIDSAYPTIATDQWVNVSASGTSGNANVILYPLNGSDLNFQDPTGTDVFYVRNVVVTETLGDSNYLPAGKYVTQVRRTSDDQVRSFTAVEVSNGTLLDWVNADLVTYTSDFSAGIDGWQHLGAGKPAQDSGPIGGEVDVLSYTESGTNVNSNSYYRRNSLTVGAIYKVTFDGFIPSNNSGLTSFSSVSMGRAFNDAVQLPALPQDQWNSYEAVSTLPALNSATVIRFNSASNATGDVAYIRNVVFAQIAADGHVSTWYDQSGNTKHATQGTPASQPKVVDAGVLVDGGIDFDGTDDFLATGSLGTVTDFPLATFSVFNRSAADQSVASTVIAEDNRGAFGNVPGFVWHTSYFSNGASVIDPSVIPNNVNVLATGLGSDLGFNNLSGGIEIGKDIPAYAFLNGTIDELIIYNSDQSDNRTAFEANIGEVYGIAGIPAYDNTVNGFVETWYDQSGNGNDASQLTASYQPKIVDAGVLLDSIVTDGIDDFFSFNSTITYAPSSGIFAVYRSDGAGRFNLIGSGATTSAVGWSQPIPTSSTIGIIFGGGQQANLTLNPTAIKANQNLLSFLWQPPLIKKALLSVNGVSEFFNFLEGQTGYDGIPQSFNVIGKRGNEYPSLQLSELIVYNTDQTANRPAIEANINNQYDIY